MNPEPRTCACGARPAKGAVQCESCGANLHQTLGGIPSASIHEEATSPMMRPAATADSGRSYTLGAVFGSYRLVKQIGSGGMGHVFIAEHTRLGRQVALKLLRSEYSDNSEAVKRFFAEAQAVNRINHENIIEVSDFIESAKGPSFYVMELLKGADLRTVEDEAGVLPLRRALGIVLQVCRGLGAAHDAGIVHRDLKPDNIFLVEREGRTDFVKLLDFGVAKLMNAALEGPSTFKSLAGVVVGTPDYMAPEQAMGDAVDHRVDIYSLGVILFELVTGERPFLADTAREVMVKHLMVAARRPSQVKTLPAPLPPQLEDLIMACLKKDARERPQSIKEVEQRLRDILEQLPEHEASLGRGRLGRTPRVLLVAGALVMVLAAVGGGLVSARKQREAAAARAVAVAEPAPPAPAAPARVQISFVSTPAGATVFRAGHDQPMGVTPFSALFDASSKAELFEFRLDGWQIGRRAVALAESRQVEVALVAVPPPPVAASEAPRKHASAAARRGTEAAKPEAPASGAKAGPKPAKLDSDVVLNPFE